MDRPGAQPEAESSIPTPDGDPDAPMSIRWDLKRDNGGGGGAMPLWTMKITLQSRSRQDCLVFVAA